MLHTTTAREACALARYISQQLNDSKESPETIVACYDAVLSSDRRRLTVAKGDDGGIVEVVLETSLHGTHWITVLR